MYDNYCADLSENHLKEEIENQIKKHVQQLPVVLEDYKDVEIEIAAVNIGMKN